MNSSIEAKEDIERLIDHFKSQALKYKSNNTIDLRDDDSLYYETTLDNCYRCIYTVFENCTLTFDTQNNYNIVFSSCVFKNCKFINYTCKALIFDKCILYNITTESCKIDKLYIVPMHTDIISEQYYYYKNNDHVVNLMNSAVKAYYNVDFTGISYNQISLNNCIGRSLSFSLPSEIYALFEYILFQSKSFKRILIGPSNKIPLKGTKFTGYKVVSIISKAALKGDVEKDVLGYAIAELEIPKDADRISSIHSDKCRCNKAKVKSIKIIYMIYDKDFYINRDLPYYHKFSKYPTSSPYNIKAIIQLIYSKSINMDERKYAAISPMYNQINLDEVREYSIIQYRKNHIIESEYDDDMFTECSKGIHFFPTVKDAIKFCIDWKI